MNIINIRLHYAQLFVICLFVITLHTMSLSLSNGIEEFDKNFSNRDFLIKSFTQIKLSLGDRVFSQVIIGKDGWLEYTGDYNLDDYQNTNPISAETLRRLQIKIKKLYNELRKRNITLIIVIAPNKASIYADKLPLEIQKLKQKSNLDIFTDYMKKNGPPVLIDIRPALQNERKKQDIYYKTDSHWNAYGAFITYTEIIKELSKTYPKLAPEEIENFSIHIGEPYLHDLPKIIGTTNILESTIEFLPTQNHTAWATLNNDRIPMQVSTLPDKNLPKLIMYMDSFGTLVKSIIATHFQEATFIQNDTKYPALTSLKKIDEIKPNIVMIEMAERSLSNNKLNDLFERLLSEKIQ